MFYVSLVVCSSAFAQENLQNFLVERGLYFEDGMVLLKDSTFIAETEATYRDYLFFENRVSHEPVAPFINSYLNDLPWDFENGEAIFLRGFRLVDSTYDQTSFHNDLFFNGPALGITYEQAKLFCLWKSDLYTAYFSKKLIARGDSLRVAYRFRLPTESEWRIACGDITQYEKNVSYGKLTKWGLKKLKIKKREGMLVDLTVKQDLPSSIKHTLYQEDINFVGDIYAHGKNGYGCFNMLGNIAEMVEERGVALGGSWRDRYDDIKTRNLRTSYTCPEYWLGFRFACDISFSYHTCPDTLLHYNVPLPAENCSVVQKRDSAIVDRQKQDDPDYLEHKIKEWVRKKLITLTDEVLSINNAPTVSFETILVHSTSVTVQMSYPSDSVELILAIYTGSKALAPRFRLWQKSGEILVYPNREDLVQGLIINLYYKGDRRTFFRVLRYP